MDAFEFGLVGVVVWMVVLFVSTVWLGADNWWLRRKCEGLQL